MLARSSTTSLRLCRPTPIRASASLRRPARSSVAVQARLHIEPFNGCNCYYLLTNSKPGWQEGNDKVDRSLEQIRNIGFSVVRTWAFQDDPLPPQGPTLYSYDTASRSMKVNPQMLKALIDLLDKAKAKGLKLMLTLTNGNPADYGGMRQYVRWSQLQQGKPDEGNQRASSLPNSAFYDDPIAQKLFEDYLKDFIPRIKDHPALHSWDLVNEPRCSTDFSGDKVTNWINKTAATVRALDPKHPITVGLDGFFGPSTPEKIKKDAKFNPYGDYTLEKTGPNVIYAGYEGADFLNNCKNLDFASLHLYPHNWQIKDDWTKWSMKWIKDHLDVVSSQDLGNMPLVLQEFNLPATDHEGRLALYKAICDLLVQHKKSNGPFVGSMIWCMSDPTEAVNDHEKYYMYDPKSGNVPDAANNKEQMNILIDCSEKMNAPATS